MSFTPPRWGFSSNRFEQVALLRSIFITYGQVQGPGGICLLSLKRTLPVVSLLGKARSTQSQSFLLAIKDSQSSRTAAHEASLVKITHTKPPNGPLSSVHRECAPLPPLI